MKQAVAIYHVSFENLGSFAPVLDAAGYAISYRSAVHDLGGLDAKSPDLVVVLGGPVGIYQDDLFPFLRDEHRLIAERLDAGLPTLGICLGSQMMAAALGSRVYPSGTVELGFKQLTLNEAGQRSPLQHLDGVPVLHWHGDTFDLPAGAELLASTDVCRHQAFTVGRHALALQFHPEADIAAMEDWFVGYAGDLAGAKVDVRAFRSEARHHIPKLREAAGKMLNAWLAGLTG